MLSPIEIEKYGRPKLTTVVSQILLFGCEVWKMSTMPVAVRFTLALSVCAGSWRTKMRTQRTKVHETRKGDDPEVLGVDHVATIELEGGAGFRCLGE